MREMQKLADVISYRTARANVSMLYVKREERCQLLSNMTITIANEHIRMHNQPSNPTSSSAWVCTQNVFVLWSCSNQSSMKYDPSTWKLMQV